VRSYTVYLTSNQASEGPGVIDHWTFYDLVSGYNVYYPTTANGDAFSYTSSPTVTAYDGNFIPWKYVVQNFTTDIQVGPLKGPYRITFDPSGLDFSQFPILKIVYDFGDGTLQTVNRNIVPNVPVDNALYSSLSTGSPTLIPVTHDYYPKDGNIPTYYNPTVTVFNGSLVRNTFNIAITSSPISIYDLGDIHLLDNVQHANTFDIQNTFEVKSPNYLTVTRSLSTVDALINTPPLIDPTSIDGLVVWLDASDALTIYKDSNNNVYRWKDKSGFNNDFYSGDVQPTFLYPRQALSLRKNINITNNISLSANSSQSLNSIIDGYTFLMVLKPNSINGSILAKGNNLNISLSAPYGINIKQGNGITNLNNISENLVNYNLLTVTLSGGNTNGNLYSTFDNTILQRKNQGYTYTTNNSPIFIGYNPQDNNSQPLIGTEISEMLIFNIPLSQEMLIILQQYLVKKWNLSLKVN